LDSTSSDVQDPLARDDRLVDIPGRHACALHLHGAEFLGRRSYAVYTTRFASNIRVTLLVGGTTELYDRACPVAWIAVYSLRTTTARTPPLYDLGSPYGTAGKDGQ